MSKYSTSTSAQLLSDVSEKIHNIDEICKQYGLYGYIINHKSNYDILGTGKYVFISTEPIDISDVKPQKTANQSDRNMQLFYPNEFAVKITDDNMLVAFNSIIDYCEKAGFLNKLYKEYETELPVAIRESEITGLKEWESVKNNEDAGYYLRTQAHKGLKTFFEKENNLNGSFQEKRAFWRSSKYDENASPRERKKDFKNRYSPIVRLNVLYQANDKINKMNISEHYLESFLNFLEKCFPEVDVALGEKELIDNGMMELAHNLTPDHPFFNGKKPVTREEYDEILRSDFAYHGFKSTRDLMPVKWETREIYFKEVDKPQIITAAHNIIYKFVLDNSLRELKERGNISILNIAPEDVALFACLAKYEKLKFHIDHSGMVSVPSFDEIHVVYNTSDEKQFKPILDEMMKIKLEFSKGASEIDNNIKSLSSVITDINESINKQAPDETTNRKPGFSEYYDR